jgi:Ion channel
MPSRTGPAARRVKPRAGRARPGALPRRVEWFGFAGAALLAVGPWIVLALMSRAVSMPTLAFWQALLMVLLVGDVVLYSKADGAGRRAIGLATVVGGASFGLAAFTQWYYLLSVQSPSAFTVVLGRADALYLAISTATTTGMGDVRPVGLAARILAMVEMVGSLSFGVVALGLVVQRLVLRADRAPRGSGRPRSRYR